MNQELVDAARSQNLANCRFRCGDLRNLPELGIERGIWCSFTAAYLMDFPAVLKRWHRELAPSGWVAITEIDNLFGHEPLGARTNFLLGTYAQDAMAAHRYDFRMGQAPEILSESGYNVSHVLTLPDKELSFNGQAAPGVIDAWRTHLDR